MLTIATLLSGGEGVGVGAQAAGLRHLWGVEIDDAIAQVARANGFNVITADIREIDPAALEQPDVLHASPECKNASQAKANGRETAEDGEVADCIVRYIETLRPRVFTLENVYPYRHFEAFGRIKASLGRLGYFYHFKNLNAADFGVPQTRRRLILRAVHGGLVPMLPAPEPWRGWYEAIEDLVPGLPESQFAPWQLERGIEKLVQETVMLAQGSFDHTDEGNERAAQPIGTRQASKPAYTIVGNSSMNTMRTFLVGRDYDRPFITDGQTNEGGCLTFRWQDEPMLTCSAGTGAKRPTRAYLSQGKIVQLTPHALARLQSFPDWYKLPEGRALASRIIGNAVPPLMYQKIVAGLARTYK